MSDDYKARFKQAFGRGLDEFMDDGKFNLVKFDAEVADVKPVGSPTSALESWGDLEAGLILELIEAGA
jgi:hypothetical protein